MEAIRQFEQAQRKAAVTPVRSGDTVRVHQQIREGNKTRIQVFEGVVIRTHRLQEVTATVTVRRIASGVGVEKTFLLHSPNVAKIEVLRRAKVRRNFLSYLRERRGKSARLQELTFDKAAVNAAGIAPEPAAELDADNEQIEVEENDDALNDAVSLDDEIKAEEREATSEDDTEATGDENELEAQEVESGVARAEPGEGEAVADNPEPTPKDAE